MYNIAHHKIFEGLSPLHNILEETKLAITVKKNNWTYLNFGTDWLFYIPLVFRPLARRHLKPIFFLYA